MDAILNLGCGWKTADHPAVVNMDKWAMLRVKYNPVLRLIAPLFLTGDRRAHYDKIPTNIRVHDLKRPLPFPDKSVDAVYHSHVLEHIDRDAAPAFLIENKRVLKPGGILRIVVPDFEELCRLYLAHVDACVSSPDEHPKHDKYVSNIIWQSVRREAWGSSIQKPMRRFVENLVLGDARARGETHQWMYDRFTLPELLKSIGFIDIHVLDYRTSQIPHWNEIGLDLDANGGPYKIQSLFVEARS